MQIRQWLRQYSTACSILLIVLLVLIAYAPSLSIPLIYDAAWEARLAHDYTWLDVFIRTGDHGYYRPLLIAVYKIAILFGANAALFMHLLALFCHTLNGYFVLRISQLLLVPSGVCRPVDTFLPLTVACLFVLNPFAVQAVGLATGLNHQMALLFMLWVLWRFLLAAGVNGANGASTAAPFAPKVLLPLLLLALMGFWSNEVALVVGGFCVVVAFYKSQESRTKNQESRIENTEELATSAAEIPNPQTLTPKPHPPNPNSSHLRLALLMVLWCGVYFAVYGLIPKGTAPEYMPLTASSSDDIARRLLYASQPLVYPVSVLLRPMPFGDTFPIREDALQLDYVAWAAILLPLLLALLTWFTRRRYLMLLGLGLYLLGIAPAVLRLSVDYVHHAPRVYYAALPGAALLWAAFIAVVVDLHDGNRNTEQKPAQLALTPSLPTWGVYGILAGLIGLIGFIHAREQIALHVRASAPVLAVAARAAQLPPASRILALDLPEWVSPPFRRFPLGAEIAQLSASYVKPSDFALANTGRAVTVNTVSPSLSFRPTLPYDHKVIGPEIEVAGLAAQVGQYEAVLWTRYLSDSLRTDWLGGVEATRDQREAGFQLADALDMRVNLTPCDQGWLLETRWRRLSPTGAALAPTLSVFAQVLGSNEAKLVQADGALIGGLLPLQALPSPDKTVLDRRILALPPSSSANRSPSDIYTLALGVYDYTNGARLALRGPDGARIQGDALYMALLAERSNQLCQ